MSPLRRFSPVLLLFATACEGTVMGTAPDIDAGSRPDAATEVNRFACASLEATFASQTPTVLLVLDRSWSMTWDFSGHRRWDAMRETLIGADGLVSRLEEEVRFGAAFYTTDFAANTCPQFHSTPPQLKSGADLAALFSDLEPQGHTPTGESLELATELISDVNEPGPKLMVLATDGLPDTCAVPHPNSTPEALQGVVTAAATAYDLGIATVVVSVGDGLTEGHLQEVANAGAGRGPDSEAADYYVALHPDELAASFETIIHGVRACTFDVETDMGLGAGEEGPRIVGGTLTLDGDALQFGSDWRLRGSRTVEVLGDACGTLKAGEHELRGELECTAIIL